MQSVVNFLFVVCKVWWIRTNKLILENFIYHKQSQIRRVIMKQAIGESQIYIHLCLWWVKKIFEACSLPTNHHHSQWPWWVWCNYSPQQSILTSIVVNSPLYTEFRAFLCVPNAQFMQIIVLHHLPILPYILSQSTYQIWTGHTAAISPPKNLRSNTHNIEH